MEPQHREGHLAQVGTQQAARNACGSSSLSKAAEGPLEREKGVHACVHLCAQHVCVRLGTHECVRSTPGAAIIPLNTPGRGAVKIAPSDSFHFARLMGRVKGVVAVACWPPPPGSETALLQMDSNPQSLP